MRLSLLLAPVILFSCTTQPSEQDQQTTNIDSVGTGITVGFDALLGEWQDALDSSGTMFHEQWRKDPDGTYTGLGFVLSGNDTVFIEHLKILQRDSGTYYAATIRTQNEGSTVHFELVHQQDSLVFTNPLHDFPQRIVYAPGLADDWNVRVSGVAKGQFTMDQYHFTRREAGSSSTGN